MSVHSMKGGAIVNIFMVLRDRDYRFWAKIRFALTTKPSVYLI
jgi:hypothetical protein